MDSKEVKEMLAKRKKLVAKQRRTELSADELKELSTIESAVKEFRNTDGGKHHRWSVR